MTNDAADRLRALLRPEPGQWDNTRLLDAALAAEYQRGRDEAVDYEKMRMEREWPTPNHMRTIADALDKITPARYGDILRWFADLCDASLDAQADHDCLMPSACGVTGFWCSNAPKIAQADR